MTKRKRCDDNDRKEDPKHFRRTIVFGDNDEFKSDGNNEGEHVHPPLLESESANLSRQFALASIQEPPTEQVPLDMPPSASAKHANSTQKPSYACRKCGRDDPPIYVLSVIKQMMLWDAPCHLMDLNVTEGQCDGSSVYPHQWD